MAYQIEKLLDFIYESKGSDMILCVGVPPSVRVHGIIRPISKIPLTKEDTMALMKSITPEHSQKELDKDGTSDFGFCYSDKCSFRVSVLRQQGLISVVMRVIPQELFQMDKIGLPEMIKDEAMRPRGLFLITGPTGSGKSTTLASIINYINENSAKHILTIEDPIEFRHKSIKSIITHREIGTDVPSFPEALRRALRQDPDVILIGEMRDLETISIALTAAETGHLVFGTLHTSSAYSTITRVVDAFPADQQDMIRVQLSGCLNIVVCQSLVEKNGGGRVPAFEIMKVTTGIRNMIRENKMQQIPAAIQVSGGEGNILLDDCLFKLFAKNTITYDKMLDKSADPRNLALKAKEWVAEQEAIKQKEAAKNKNAQR